MHDPVTVHAPEIFIVIGTCGEWSDRKEWVVCWYEDEARAQDHAVRATQRAAEINAIRDAADHSRYGGDDELKNEWDPRCSFDSGDTNYRVEDAAHGSMHQGEAPCSIPSASSAPSG